MHFTQSRYTQVNQAYLTTVLYRCCCCPRLFRVFNFKAKIKYVKIHVFFLMVLPSATSVEAVLPPPVTQSTETVPSAEVRPQGAEGLAVLEPDAPLDDSLTWAERVELEEAENHEFSPTFPPQENPEAGQALAATPPCPPPVLRPSLQPRYVVLAVRPIVFAGDAHQLVPFLLFQFSTDLTPAD